MRRLRLKGRWSTEPSLEGGITGVLTFSATQGLKLALDDAFINEFPGPDLYDVVFGIVDSQQPGRFVKLTRCLRTKSKLVSSGSASEEVSPAFALFSSQPFERDELLVQNATIRFEGLDEWAGSGGGLDLEVESERTALTLRYRPMEQISIDTETGSIAWTYGPSWRRSRSSFRIQERASIELGLFVPATIDQLLNTQTRPIQDFLTFAIGRPVAVTQFTVTPRSEGLEPSPTSVFYKPTYVAAKHEGHIRRDTMLFHLGDVGMSLKQLVNEWLTLHKSLSAFCGAFFGLVYAPPKFVEIRFDWTLHCADLLRMSSASLRARPESVDTTLRWLLDSAGDLSSFSTSGRNDEFVHRIVDARNRMHHGQELSGVQVHWLTEALRWIITASLLLRMRATAALADEILHRSPSAAFTSQQLLTQI